MAYLHIDVSKIDTRTAVAFFLPCVLFYGYLISLLFFFCFHFIAISSSKYIYTFVSFAIFGFCDYKYINKSKTTLNWHWTRMKNRNNFCVVLGYVLRSICVCSVCYCSIWYASVGLHQLTSIEMLRIQLKQIVK